MKQLILFCLVSSFCCAQSTKVSVWDIRPDSLCPGDSIFMLYKLQISDHNDNSMNDVYIDLSVAWSGNLATLKSQPKEKWPTSPDSVYVMGFKTSSALSVGTHTLKGNYGASHTFTAKDCSCTVAADLSVTVSGMTATLQSVTTGTDSNTQFKWNFGFATGWQDGPSTVTYTYTTQKTYTVGLFVINPTCQDTTYRSITVKEPKDTSTVGIREYSLDQLKPVYFDLYGNSTELKPGLLIERVGTKRRKILVQ